MDVLLTPILISLAALVVVLIELLVIRFSDKADYDLDSVATYIYELDDPDVLKELSILTDVRRLLLHLELTEGRPRLG